jgi:hypothetical protein
MKKSAAALGLLGLALATSVFASEGKAPEGIRHLDHVFVIMMENTGYNQIINNPNAPFINKLAQSANLATNYFAIGHPSLTNYLEVVGGSNFGVRSDNNSDWHSTTCSTNLATGFVTTDNPASPAICPIFGTGTDAETPATDSTNETQTQVLNNIDGIQSIPALKITTGKTIADQLFEAGRSWKSYQEDLPISGADLVNNSDGIYSNLTDFTKFLPALNPPLTSAGIVNLYAAKHNPFVYFQSVQEGRNPELSLANVVGFDGVNGLYGDLASGKVPTFSFIVPNQCNDQHGRGNSTPYCNYNPVSDGTQAGLNPALIQNGDVTVQKLVTAIKSSTVWAEGNNAIVVLWDENDYSAVPNINQVVLIVDTNYGVSGKQSSVRYNHFSLLKSIEAALELPCLNHACDANVHVMSDLFGSQHDNRK